MAVDPEVEEVVPVVEEDVDSEVSVVTVDCVDWVEEFVPVP